MLSSLLDTFKSSIKSVDETLISPLNPIRFVEDALFCTSQLALSYSDPDQKWIIRQHLISLFQDYPFLKPSIGLFTHNDGTEVKLLNANGELPVSRPGPSVPVTIWVHELYPQTPPIVYVNISDSSHPVYENHPFSDPSGRTLTPYLISWRFDKCDLSCLVRNLINVFNHNHPFFYTCHDHGAHEYQSRSHPSVFSKTEAMDRLVGTMHYDAIAITNKNDEEIESLTMVQVELRSRSGHLKTVVHGLERERGRLKGRVKALRDERDVVLSWLRVHEGGLGNLEEIEDVFGCLDSESEIKRECLATDSALEDSIYALDRAVEEGVVEFGVYLKQVRVLAREQFLNRAKMVKIDGS